MSTTLKQPLRILYVDNEPGDILLMRAVIEVIQHDGQFSYALGADQAKALLAKAVRDHAVLPDLVLTDLYMPGTRGDELVRSIKEDPSLRHIAVVVLTTSELDSDHRFCMNAGASGVYVKPPGLDDLVVLIEDVLARVEVPDEPVAAGH
jgi:twitching motility two-component system response regulator PilH